MLKSLRLVTPYLKENRWTIVTGLVCLIGVDFLQLVIPRVIKWTVDDLTAYRAHTGDLLRYALYIVVMAALIGVFRYVWRRCLIGMSRSLEEGLRNRLFFHLQTLSAPYFARMKTGDLMAHATNDLQHVRMAMGMGIVALTDAVVLGTAAIAFMVYINLHLTLLVLIPMPLIVFGARFFSKKMHRLYQQVQAAFSDLTEEVRETFAGIRIVKAYNLEPQTDARLASVSRNYVTQNLKLASVTGSFFPMMILFSNLSLVIVLYLGGRQTITATISAGDFVAFISYLALLTWPMMAMGWVTNLIQRGKASLDRIGRILETRPAIVDPPDARPLARAAGELVFEQVSFAYSAASTDSAPRPILEKIDLRLPPGGVLGIVGPPGSGKTTLLTLIPRLFEITGGRILLDGRDIRTLPLANLRGHISFMPQEPFMFAGTVRENILLSRPEATEAELEQALRGAALLETIAAFPKGLETVVGERGIILSGGQKLRIGLARLLLHDRRILILDDPVSQVDTQTAAVILDALRAMTGRRTLLIVSHRLPAVRFADRIIVLDQARITEAGTHAELMTRNRYYARTFRLQEIEEEFNAL